MQNAQKRNWLNTLTLAIANYVSAEACLVFYKITSRLCKSFFFFFFFCYEKEQKGFSILGAILFVSGHLSFFSLQKAVYLSTLSRRIPGNMKQTDFFVTGTKQLGLVWVSHCFLIFQLPLLEPLGKYISSCPAYVLSVATEFHRIWDYYGLRSSYTTDIMKLKSV